MIAQCVWRCTYLTSTVTLQLMRSILGWPGDAFECFCYASRAQSRLYICAPALVTWEIEAEADIRGTTRRRYHNCTASVRKPRCGPRTAQIATRSTSPTLSLLLPQRDLPHDVRPTTAPRRVTRCCLLETDKAWHFRTVRHIAPERRRWHARDCGMSLMLPGLESSGDG